MPESKKKFSFSSFKFKNKFNLRQTDQLIEKLSKIKILDKIENFLKNNCASTIALIETLLGLTFFLTISYPQIFSSFEFFTQRWFSISIMVLAITLSYIFAFYFKKTEGFWSSFSIWFQSTILTFYSFAYYLRLSNNSLRILDHEFTTGIIFIPLSLLIFFFHYNLFSENKRVFWIVFSQVMLILIYTYSFVNFLSIDNTFDRSFTLNWLDLIFAWPSWIWILISSAFISYVSFVNLDSPIKVKRIFIIISFFLIMQTMILIYFFGESSYWKKTLLSLIVWNYLITNLVPIALKTKDINYRPKLIIASIYHFVLFFSTFILI
jgi:hypothetical protein